MIDGLQTRIYKLSSLVHIGLEKANMRRRKITADDKNVPSDEEIRRIMEIGQKMYKDFGHTKNTTINMDETAFTYAIGSEYMYCPTRPEHWHPKYIPTDNSSCCSKW